MTLFDETIASGVQLKRTMTSLAAPKISVIMPAYNEEKKIVRSIEGATAHLKRLAYPYEIIIVDDGSTDGTRSEAIRASIDPHVKVAGYDRNQGKGFAVKYGLKHVSGDVVVFMDSDADVRADLVKLYVTVLRDNDVAIASKWHPASRVSAPIVRKLLSYAFNRLILLLTGVRVSDAQCGFKAFKREPLEKMMILVSVKRYVFDVELLVAAKLLGLRIIELPINLRLTSLFSARHIFRMLVDILGIAYRLRVIHWYQRNLHDPQASYKPIIRW